MANPEAQVAEVKKLVHDAARGAIKAGADTARGTLDAGNDQAHRASDSLFKAAEEAAAFGRGNVEAFSRATQAYVAGIQDVGRQTLGLFQVMADQAMESAKAFATVRTFEDVTELHTRLARTAFDRSLAEVTRLQEASQRVAEQTMAPLTARMTLAVERLGRPTVA